MNESGSLRVAACVALLISANCLFAAGLSKTWKEWPQTPQGYYMTEGERAQWSVLQSDADAAKFVADFLARRGGDPFVAEVARNAAQADKYLSLGKTPGSSTVRGKMMILLGPVAPVSATKKKRNGEVRMAPNSSMGGLNGPTMEDMQSASNDPGNSTTFMTEYTYTYPAASLPAAYGKALTVKIEVDPSSEHDRLSGIGVEKELNKVYEMAAQARLAAAKPPNP
jgi:hypothetical protein